MGVLKNIGKFILGAILKSIVIVLGVLLIWLAFCLIFEGVNQNSLRAGLEMFLSSKITVYVIGWIVGGVVSMYEGIKDQHFATFLAGFVMFFTPIILLHLSTPNPAIELYDSSGNIWTLMKK